MKNQVKSWLLLLSSSPFLFNTASASQCECGYLDPITQSLWTDASITYWNESSSAQDIVLNPIESPSDYGAASSGNTGDGQEAWVSRENLNQWEDSFQATFRAGTKHNNSFITPDGLNLAVQPADMEHRISYGSEIITRRRDILYGSLRASLKAPEPYQGGTVLRWQAAYNTSDYISTSIFSSDESMNSTYQWTYSAARHSSQPFVNPLSALQDEYGFNEQRIDWISPDALKFSTDGTTNATAQIWDLNRKRNGNLPTLGGPVSLRHSSNGEKSQSQGPPIYHQPTAQIKYTRFFFNSSLPSRHAEFKQQCQQTATPVCSTEDNTLRGSTAFTLAATEKIEAPKIGHEIPLYAIIAEACSGGIFVILLVNALIERQLKAKRKEREFYAKQQQVSSEQNDRDEGFAADHQASSMDDEDSFSSEETKAEFEKALKAWEDPSKLDPESDSDFDSSAEESDGEDDPDDPLRINKRNDIRSFGHGSFGHQDGLLTPGGLPRYVPPIFYARSSIAASIASGSHTPAHVSAAGNLEHDDLQGLDERLLGLQESEIMEDGQAGSRSNHSRKGSASASGHLSNPRGLGSIMDEEDIGTSQSGHLGHLNIPTSSSHGHSSFSDHAPGGHGFSYSSRGRLSKAPSTIGSISDLPVPGSEDGHWGGGLLHGVGTAPIREGLPTSQSQTRLLSSSRAASFVETDGSIHAVTWNPRIVEWKPFDPSQNEANGGQLAERADGTTTVAQRPQTPAIQAATGFVGWMGRVARSLLVGEGGAGQTASGAARVEYLDGLRGFACFLVSFHHFMLIFYYNVTTPSGPAHYPQMERWLRNLLGAILTNGGFNIGVFFILAARVIANRYLVRGRLQDLSEATHRRVPRLMIPISAGMVLSYFFIEADAFHWLPRLASRSWSTWSYYQNYDNIGTFLDSWMTLWFTTPPQVPYVITTYATGILWTVPVIVSSSWTVFTCALIAYEIPNVKKRYSFYAACFLLSWYADRFDYFFIAGLVIADMDNKLKYRKLAAEGFPILPSFLLRHLPERLQKFRVHGQVFAWIIMLAGAVVSWLEQINGPGEQIPLLEHGIHPDWQTAQPKVWADENTLVYTDPRLFDFFFVIGFFLLCDLCSSFRTFFQLRFWSAFGRNAFSLYLLHGVIFWSWGSWITLQLLMKDVPYWATIIVTFITSYALLAVLCEAFTNTFDKWGVGLSKAFWRETSGGLGRRV